MNGAANKRKLAECRPKAVKTEETAEEIYNVWRLHWPHSPEWGKASDTIKRDCRTIAKWHLDKIKK